MTEILESKSREHQTYGKSVEGEAKWEGPLGRTVQEMFGKAPGQSLSPS